MVKTLSIGGVQDSIDSFKTWPKGLKPVVNIC